MPHMVVSVLDTRVDCQGKTKLKTRLTGYAVGLQKKQEGNPAQQWRFTKEGSIHSVVGVYCLAISLVFLCASKLPHDCFKCFDI